jgi:hypothetical protein
MSDSQQTNNPMRLKDLTRFRIQSLSYVFHFLDQPCWIELAQYFQRYFNSIDPLKRDEYNVLSPLQIFCALNKLDKKGLVEPLYVRDIPKFNDLKVRDFIDQILEEYIQENTQVST